MRNRIAAVVAALLPLMVVVGGLEGCGGGGGGGTSPFGAGAASGGAASGAASGVGVVDPDVTKTLTVVLVVKPKAITTSTPGTVTALVKDAAGVPVAGAFVTFTVSDAKIAQIAPSTVETDDTGYATAKLSPIAGANAGAAKVTAKAELLDGSGATATYTSVFSIVPDKISIGTLSTPSPTIDAYASTPIVFTLTSVSSANPITLEFSSECVSLKKAEITPDKISVGIATGAVTYKDLGCGSPDRVNAKISGIDQTKSVDLRAAAPAIQGIEFVSASPQSIAIAGSGGPTTSQVKFKIVDQEGKPVSGKNVALTLDVPSIAVLTPVSATSDPSGIVLVSVQSQLTPGPVRVRAKIITDPPSNMLAFSSQLTINSALPTQNGVSLSAEKYSLDTTDESDKSGVNVRLTDRFSNPVVDGTVINFRSSGASMVPAYCQTIDGACSVSLIVSNPRPLNGKVSVVAYAAGEESFVDSDANHKYTEGEGVDQLGKIFFDLVNFTGIDPANYSSKNFVAGADANSVWDEGIYVRAQWKFFLASPSRPRIYFPNDAGRCDQPDQISVIPQGKLLTDEMKFDLSESGACRYTKVICMRDANKNADISTNGVDAGNPVPSGATLSVETSAKGVSVSIDGSPISATVSGPTRHTLVVRKSSCEKPNSSGGSIDLTVTMPGGQIHTLLDIAEVKSPPPLPIP